MVADDNGGGQCQHAKLGSRLQWRRMKEGGERQQRQWSGDDGCGGGRRRQRTTTAKMVSDSCGRQRHARLDGGLRQGMTRAGGERRQRQQSGNDGCDGSTWQWPMTMVAVGDDSDGGGR